MVAPIVGPITTEVGGLGPDIQPYYSYQKKYRQSPPIDQPLPYLRDVGKLVWKVGNPPGAARSVGTSVHNTSIVNWDDLTSKSYDKLKGKMADSAQMAVGLIEGRQSLAMIAARSGQLLQFGRRLSRLDFGGAAKVLRLSAVPKGVSIKKSFASNWLEYYFGWLPLIGDIGSAVNVLQSPLKEQFVKAGAKSSGAYWNVQSPQEASRPNALNDWSYLKSFETITVDRQAMGQGVKVAVSNPNLWLANQLGFVNPAAITWELIPFSFVVDWFVNVEQFLSSGTDFLGLTLEDAWNVKYLELTREYYKFVRYRWWVPGTYYPNAQYYYTETLDRAICKGYHTVRSTGLASPALYVRPLKLWKWKRALTAVSLLTQQLSRR